MNEMLWSVDQAIADAETFAKSTHEAAGRAAHLVSKNRDLLVASRKMLAQSAFHLKRTNRPWAINWEQEASHLTLAESHIKDARERIQRQRHLITRLAKQRQPTDTAELILQTMLCTLKAMEGHRDIILARFSAP